MYIPKVIWYQVNDISVWIILILIMLIMLLYLKYNFTIKYNISICNFRRNCEKIGFRDVIFNNISV